VDSSGGGVEGRRPPMIEPERRRSRRTPSSNEERGVALSCFKGRSNEALPPRMGATVVDRGPNPPLEKKDRTLLDTNEGRWSFFSLDSIRSVFGREGTLGTGGTVREGGGSFGLGKTSGT
jgi:hypothetical protein